VAFHTIIILNPQLKYQIFVPDRATLTKYEKQFNKSLQEIEAFNLQPNQTFMQTINQFAHLSINDIFKHSMGMSLIQFEAPTFTNERQNEEICYPKPIDWSKIHGAVAPVYDHL
jgi:hypothetical protein